MRTRERERGTAVVELAISVPVIFMLILLVTEGAALIRTHQLINNAAREGARLSTLPPNQCFGEANCLAQIRQIVVNYGSNNGITINPANVTIVQNGMIATSGPAISSSRVTVVYSYAFQFRPPLFGIPASTDLAAQAEFRNLY